jgi:hypothetical protein
MTAPGRDPIADGQYFGDMPTKPSAAADLVGRAYAGAVGRHRKAPEQPPTTPELATAIDTEALAGLRRKAGEPDAVRALLAERVGVARDADLATITAALDHALAERPFAGPPTGSELVDVETMNQLREAAAAGQNVRRDALLANAITTGKIPPASRRAWEVLLEADPAAAETTLRSLPAGLIPVSMVGHSGRHEDDVYGELFGP